MTDECALQLLSRQGFDDPKEYGPNPPIIIKELLAILQTLTVTRVFDDQ